MFKVNRGSGLPLLLALALLSPIAALSQTSVTRDVRDFELIAVDGNHLVVRGPNGTRELTVPPDFRFTVDGKSLTVGDLKPGMKGTATVTTTTIERPVYVTTVKMGTVLSQNGRSVVIREDNGTIRRFTQSESDARGVSWYINDKPVRLTDLEKGDTLAATIVSQGPPEILTMQEVDAQLAAAGEAAVAAEAPADEAASVPPAAAPAAAPAPEPQAATQEAAPEPTAAETSTPFDDLPKPYTKNPFFWLLVTIVVVALVWVVARRRVKKPLQR